jgi:hypothetical protein
VRAFADEAIHGAAGIYVVGAALVAPERVDDLRLDVRGLLLKKQLRFHWRDEGEGQRQRMLEWLASAEGLDVCAYIVNPFEPTRQDRARALCLKGLLWDLNEHQATHLVIESRQDHNDRIDQQLILDLRKSKVASEDLNYGFSRPIDEPLLWIADAVSSCVAAYVRNGAYADRLGGWPLAILTM